MGGWRFMCIGLRKAVSDELLAVRVINAERRFLFG